MANKMFDLSYQELQLLVTQFHSEKGVITDIHERFLVYEAFKREADGTDPYTMKWAEQTLMLSFPKVYSMIQKMVKHGYLRRRRSTDDKRIVFLEATNKLIDGIDLYEDMKLNELNALGITTQKVASRPSFSELNQSSATRIQELFLTKDRK